MTTRRNRRWDTGTWLDLRQLADQLQHPLPAHPRQMTDTQHAYAEALLTLSGRMSDFANSADNLVEKIQYVSGNSPRHWLRNVDGFVNDITESLNTIGSHQYNGWTLLAALHTARTAINADRTANTESEQ